VFDTLDEACASIESLVPLQSDTSDLKALGIDPAKIPNTVQLTHADVVRYFVSASMLTKEDLDPGIVACLQARDACRGLEILASKITRNRESNFFTNCFNFKRRTETTGWRLNAVILLLNTVVVYCSWGGQPLVNETELRSNPLGFLQAIEGLAEFPKPAKLTSA
jgi:hypothetical protein